MTELTKTAFAKHLGLSPSRISQYIKAGMPTRWDGRVNTEKAECWIRSRIRTTRNRWPTGAGFASMPWTGPMTPDTDIITELLLDAADIIGDRGVVPVLADLAAAYGRPASVRGRKPRWSEMREALKDLQAAVRLMQRTAQSLPALLETFNFDPVGTLRPVYDGADFAQTLGHYLKAGNGRIEAEFVRGGAKRPRRGRPAKWMMAVAAADLLEQSRPGSVSSTRSGTFYRLVVLIHQAAGHDDETGLADVVCEVGKRWRQRRIAAARGEWAEVERLTAELQDG